MRSGGIAWIAMVAVGCSGGSSPAATGSSGGTATLSAEATKFLRSYCAFWEPCCTKASHTYEGSACPNAFGERLASAPYDAAKASDCLALLATESKKPGFCTNLPESVHTACDTGIFGKVPPGSVAPGAMCGADVDCETSSEGPVHCRGVELYKRTCYVDVKGSENDACAGTRSPEYGEALRSLGSAPHLVICNTTDGVFCDATQKCAKVAELGAPCDLKQPYPCVPSAYCSPSTKTCVARLADGSSCLIEGPSACMHGEYCVQARSCGAAIPVGASCKIGEECVDSSCEDGKCLVRTTGGTYIQNLVCPL